MLIVLNFNWYVKWHLQLYSLETLIVNFLYKTGGKHSIPELHGWEYQFKIHALSYF